MDLPFFIKVVPSFRRSFLETFLETFLWGFAASLAVFGLSFLDAFFLALVRETFLALGSDVLIGFLDLAEFDWFEEKRGSLVRVSSLCSLREKS